MKTSLSIDHVLSDLEAQLAHHEGQEAFHAQQEIFHREQRILHAEGVGKVRERYEAFKAGVAAAGEIFASLPQAAPAPPAPSLSDGDDGRRSTVAKLVLRLVAAKAENETFTPSSVAAELNARFAARRRHPFEGRDASVYLRRLLAEGDLRLVRKGGAAHEAVYTRRLD
jgi:hypothetical protein